MSSLPEEIYLEILLRVPAKSTIVCKCVCKSWFQLISNPDFVKMHLNLSIKKNNNWSVIFKFSDKAYRMYFGYESHDDAVAVEFETPYEYLTNRSSKLLGSCNGIVYGWNRPSKFFFLWNPATKEFKRLPKSDVYGYHGFGYDYKTCDYKLVNIKGNKENSLVNVYSLESNSWKSLKSIPYEFRLIQQSGVLFNGALHWFDAVIGNESSIVSMDISEERFEQLQRPMILPTQYYMNMGVLEECLCVLVGNKEFFEVWVMQDYGVPESWAKLYTITYKSIKCYIHTAELIGSFKDGEIVFKNHGHMILYDLNYGTARKLEIDDTGYGGEAVKYLESLVSLNSVTAVGRSKKREITYEQH